MCEVVIGTATGVDRYTIPCDVTEHSTEDAQ